MSTSNLTNFYSHPRNFKLVPETKKRGRERREKFERRASITVHHGSRHDEMIKRTTFWSLHCYASDITISLWLMQTFVADSAAMYCPLPSPLIPSLLPPRSTRARCVVTSVFASAYVMITRVSGSVCNCSPFLPPKWRGGKERRGGYGTWFPVNFVERTREARGRGDKNAGFIIEIFSVDNIIVARMRA